MKGRGGLVNTLAPEYEGAEVGRREEVAAERSRFMHQAERGHKGRRKGRGWWRGGRSRLM